MKLRRITIGRLPGIDSPFTIDEIGDGLQVVIGPNAIGKSSLCRATRALLWQGEEVTRPFSANARFDREGDVWTVERENSESCWLREGLESSPPPLPAQHLSKCFFLELRDLLEISEDAGRDLADRVRHQMAGGFDLDAVSRALFTARSGRSPGSKERKKYDQAHDGVNRSVRSQANLAADEARLAELAAREAESKEANRRLPHVERALDLAKKRAARIEMEQGLALFPDALGRLRGNELEQVEQREEELARKRGERESQQSRLERASRDATSAGLAEPIDRALLSSWQRLLEKLADLDARLEHARLGVAGAAEKRGRAAEKLGATPGTDDPPLDRRASEALFEFRRDAQHAAEKRTALEERIRLLRGRDFGADERERLTLLQENIPHLRTWLRTPAATPGDRDPGTSKRMSIAGWSSLILGAVLAFLVSPWLVALAGIGVGLLVGARRSASGPGDGIREAMQQQLASEIAAPTSWCEGAVHELLRSLERERDELAAADVRAERRTSDRVGLESELAGLEPEALEIDERRQALGSSLGLAELPPDVELVQMAIDLDEFHRARHEEADERGKLEGLQGEASKHLDELGRALTIHGIEKPTGLESARIAVQTIVDRDGRIRDALLRQTQSRELLKTLDSEILEIDGVLGEIYGLAEVEGGDRARLAALLEGFEGRQEIEKQRDRLSGQIDLIEVELRNAGEDALTASNTGELEAERARLADLAAEHAGWVNEIARINSDVKVARSGHDLTDAQAAEDEALRSLESARDDLLFVTAGGFLIDSVRSEHESNQMPEVLERACELFSLFTHREYELQVTNSGGTSFIAVETRTGARRRPVELSDGTRAQLILAARLAFAEEVESGARLPMFLDEALDHSDPERFDAIARALGRMVEDEDRQIFYLTNDPTDAARIEAAFEAEQCAPPGRIDLGAIRKREASVSGAEELRVEPRASIPAPGGRSAGEYGALLGVHPLDPMATTSSQHLFHVLGDELEVLHLLLERRLEVVGHWHILSRRDADLVQAILSKHGGVLTRESIDARCQLLDAFCEAWREGRGRSIDRHVIEASGDIISSNYREELIAVAADLAGDAERVVAALRCASKDLDVRLKGMRKRPEVADQFEAHLLEQQFLDPRTRLSESDVVARVNASPAAAQLPAAFVAEATHRWWVLCGRATGA